MRRERKLHKGKAKQLNDSERKTTIYDIAEEAKISASTVSLVLNGRWKKYRISKKTAERVLALAKAKGFTVNLGARGLRLSRSGLCGMIVPHYRNRFFASLAEAFEAQSRARGLCPVIVSAHREDETEREAAATLISHQVEFLFVAGVRDPTAINQLCEDANIRSINVDLPGTHAPSAISDNREAARQLTNSLLDTLGPEKALDFQFYGGHAEDNSTVERIDGVRQAYMARGLEVPDSAYLPCGYSPPEIAEAIFGHLEKRKEANPPSAVFANGITALEGMLILRNTRGVDLLSDTFIGCYDWDPFAANLRHDISFVRQDIEGLVSAGFELLDETKKGEYPTIRVPAELRLSAAALARKNDVSTTTGNQ